MCYLLLFTAYMFKCPFYVAAVLLHFTYNKFAARNVRLGT
jgi:hypothetical protein